MRRRDFIKVIAGSAAAWPLAAHAQQPERMRRISVLLPATADNPDFQASHAAEIRKHAAELAALAPDVILAHGTSTVGPLLQATRTVPIVFPVIVDPVASGFVDSLARPGGNATGFMSFEYSIGGKWLELLKQIAPGVTRAAVIR